MGMREGQTIKNLQELTLLSTLKKERWTVMCAYNKRHSCDKTKVVKDNLFHILTYIQGKRI